MSSSIQVCHSGQSGNITTVSFDQNGGSGGGLDSKSQTCQIQIRVQLHVLNTNITNIPIRLQVRGSVGNKEWEMVGRVRL